MQDFQRLNFLHRDDQNLHKQKIAAFWIVEIEPFAGKCTTFQGGLRCGTRRVMLQRNVVGLD